MGTPAHGADVRTDLITDAVRTLLSVPVPTVYVSQVPESVPATAGVLQPYACLYPSAGTVATDSLAVRPTDVLWSALLTVAAADRAGVEKTVRAARAHALGARLTVAGVGTGRLRETPMDVPVAEDRDAHPTRWWTQLRVTVHAVARPT